MLQTEMRGLIWAIAQSGVVAVVLAIGLADGAIGQIVPDDTLGAERSQITPGTVGNRAADRIAGGARRGSDLFHSFRSFNIGAGQQVYFNNPTGVRNILSRVTGNDVSNILGTLGVDGGANLFLLNPNGIVFGQNARLDVRGSFLATTADRFVFPNQITFGAVNPEAPPLLNVTVPIGLQYGRNPGAIASRASLLVDSGRSLVLAGGAIDLGSSILAVRFPDGGRIELGGVNNAGTVDLNQQGNLFSLSFPANLEGADISLRNSILAARATNGGDIAITGRSISVLAGSELQAGIAAGYGSVGSQAGDITLNAARTVRVDRESLIGNIVVAATDTNPAAIGNAGNIRISAGSLSLTKDAQLDASTFGHGNAGDLIIDTNGHFSADGSYLISAVGRTGVGRGGNIRIATDSLSLTRGAQLIANTLGHGNAGDVVVDAHHIAIDGVSTTGGFISGALSTVEQTGVGQGGNIRISTDSLSLTGGGQLQSSTKGRGNAGDVIVDAHHISIDGVSTTGGFISGALSTVEQTGVGRGGSVHITTDSLSITHGAQLQSATKGHGDAGDITIDVQDSLSLTHGAQLLANTFGRGNAGDVIIDAHHIAIDGVSARGGFTSGALSTVEQTGVGQGGDIRISTDFLSFTGGAQLQSSTKGRGNAGDVIIDAHHIAIDGVSARGGFTSGALSTVERTGAGQGGRIQISTDSLSLTGGGQLQSLTRGHGNAGDVIVDAHSISIDGVSTTGGFISGALSTVEQTGVGQGGNIQISTHLLSIINGARFSAASGGGGNAGDININANQVILDRGTISTQTESSNGGNITLQNADLLTLLHSSRITTSAGLSQASGNGGNITLNANLIAASANDNNDITANAFNGRGGTVNITGQLAGISLLSRDELQTRLGTTNPQNLDPSKLPTNDITAVSQNAPTLNGQVTVNPPNLDPSRGLIELPTVPIDTTNQLSQVCPTNTQQADRLDSFVNSRRGGLPPNPTDLLSADNSLTEWVTPGTSGNAHVEASPPSSTQPIVEAQGWVRNAQGKVTLVAPTPPSISPAQCK